MSEETMNEDTIERRINMRNRNIGISYASAVNRTINKYPDHNTQTHSSGRQGCIRCMGGGTYQVIAILMFMAAMNSADPLILGLAFLEVEPTNYQCYYDPNTPENPSDEGQWQSCTKDDVCGKELPHDRYRPDTSDPEYIDNWVEKFDLLCKPKSRLGLFGLYFFIGIISTIIVFPKIADMYGRREMFIQTMAVTLFAQLVLIITNDLLTAQVMMLLLGSTFAGKCIIGLSYLIEYMTLPFTANVIFIQLIVEPILTIIITVWYQFIDRHWLILQVVSLIITLITLIYLAIWVPESPKFSYALRDYDESRKVLQYVGEQNGLSDRQLRMSNRFKYKYDTEVRDERENEAIHVLDPENQFIDEQQGSGDNEIVEDTENLLGTASSSTELDSYRKPAVDDRTFCSRIDYIDWHSHSRKSQGSMELWYYRLNLIRLIIMWTASSFASYFMFFENKYMEGNIYIFYYYEGITGVIASLLAQVLYMMLNTRKSFIVSIAFVLFGALMILLFETEVLKADFVDFMNPQKSPYPPGSPEDHEYHLRMIIPMFILFTKISINILFQITYLASFCDDSIFPYLKRATSIGICNFVARISTVFAPQVAEQPKPMPEVYLLIIVSVAFVIAFTLPLDDYDESPETEISFNSESKPTKNKNKKEMQFAEGGNASDEGESDIEEETPDEMKTKQQSQRKYTDQRLKED